MTKRRGQGERAKEPLFLLLLSPSQSLQRLFSSVLHSAPLSTIHYPLSTFHYAWNRLVHSGLKSFSQCRCKGSIDVHKSGAFDILINALALVNKKRHIFPFSVSLQRKVFGDLFLTIVFHRRQKRVKIFSGTYVTKHLYKSDSKTSNVHVSCILIHNYLKEKTRKKKESLLISYHWLSPS